jgi:hypothetical protein
MGLHSALAIKRQRKRRDEQKKARERRYSTHSTESHAHGFSPRHSIVSLDKQRQRKQGMMDTKVVSSVGMLHIGVVFMVFGGFLIVSALLPATDDEVSPKDAKTELWSELLFSGIFCMVMGIFLIILNHFVSKQADDDLNTYVSNQLNRSKSGHRLVRDVETGHMSSNRQSKGESASSSSMHLSQEAKRDDLDQIDPVPVHGSATQNHPHHHNPHLNSPPPCINGEPPLEKIIEEDCSEYSIASSRRQQRFFCEKGEEETRTTDNFDKEYDNSTTASLSPGTPSETQELLTSRSMKAYHT